MNLAFLHLNPSSILLTSSVRDSSFLGSSHSASSFPIHFKPIHPIHPIRTASIKCSSLTNSPPTKQDDIVITPPPSNCKQTPERKLIPIIGTFIDLLTNRQTGPILAREYGPVYKTKFLGIPFYNINDMQAISRVHKDSATFLSGGAFPPTFLKLFGETLLVTLDGHKHFVKRSSASSAFSPQMFPLYFEPILSSSQALWEKMASDLKSNSTVKLDAYTREHFLRMIVRISTGLEDAGTLSFDDLQRNFLAFTSALFSPQFGPVWNKGLRSRQVLLDVYTNLIIDRLENDAKKIDELRSYGDDLAKMARRNIRGGSLDVLTVAVAMSPLKTGPGHTHDPKVIEELAELILFLWFAGFATQAVSSLSVMMTLGFDDEARKRLIEEQDSIVERYGNDEMTIEQVNKEMPLLDSCVTEVLRMYPPSTATFRKVTSDTSVLGHFIPKDSLILLDIWGSQRNDEYYEKADEFRVDRFLPKKDKNEPKPPSIISFGAVGGAHFCLGGALAMVSLKTTFASLLRYYDFGLDPKQNREYIPLPELRPKSMVVFERVERRNVEKKEEVVGLKAGKEGEM